MAIFKKQGVYWIDFYFNGRRVREKVGPSHKLAQEVLHKRKLEIAEQKYFPARAVQKITLRDFFEKYWRLHGQFLRSGNIKHAMNKLLQEFGSRRFDDIHSVDIQEFYNQKVAETSVSTANRYRSYMHTLFNCAKLWGDFHGENPVTRVKPRREKNRRDRFLSENEMATLMCSCSARILPIIKCALLTGMRKGELLGLSWQNVDLQHRVIYILVSKSGKRREIPIGEKLHEVFTELIPKGEGSVFNLPDVTLRRHFALALKSGKIPNFRFHDLRHTFASYFAMRTSNLVVLQQLLGHSTPTLTLRYAHFAKGHLAAEMHDFESGIPILSLDGHQYGHQEVLPVPPNPSKIAVNQ